MDLGTLANVGLVALFILIGGVFAGTEIAFVSLRESQIDQLDRRGGRGARVAAVARDPNRFLAAVQIGVTVAGFFSAAYGASTIAPDVAPYLEDLGLSAGVSGSVALIALTLLIAYLSLVFGELVPKRFALQKSTGLALITGPPLDRFARLMRPVIWLLSISTNAVVRLLGGDPRATNEEMTEEELRELVITHEGLPDDERRILHDVFSAADRSVAEVMQPRPDVAFLSRDSTLDETVATIAEQPYSRYPVTGEDFDDVIGFVHVRDLFAAQQRPGAADVLIGDLVREIVVVPATNPLLPTMSMMRQSRVHIAVVIDEYGGTDGIVTLEDLVEELVGEIEDEHDDEDADIEGDRTVEGALNIEDFADETGVELPDSGDYETVAGYVLVQLGRVAEVGDTVTAGEHVIEVVEVDGHRIARVRVTR
ncbi:hemolysin family protein [Aeromicrobium piscarium]|uniref:HlyC/CorC family transporter n=1 Tax=Aeromicrobium piscarium TaxID=2590901 RepID=A0A554S7A6_9ACTN|nr:hemolysin family protein [Aeromicrobium piscarium]TSD62243.1 HlyC/CorC family transporter [Aeromicrobium piscarium]